jgi:hypothetical protein
MADCYQPTAHDYRLIILSRQWAMRCVELYTVANEYLHSLRYEAYITLVPNYLERFLFRSATKTLPFWNAYNLSLPCVEFLLNAVFQWRPSSLCEGLLSPLLQIRVSHLIWVPGSWLGPVLYRSLSMKFILLSWYMQIAFTYRGLSNVLGLPIVRTFLWQTFQRPSPSFHRYALFKEILILKNTVVWRVTPCSLVEVYQHFRGTYCVCLQDRGICEETDRNQGASIVIAGCFLDIFFDPEDIGNA